MFLLTLLTITAASAARLDHSVLLPPHAGSSSGADSGLQAPHDLDTHHHNPQGHHAALQANPSATAEILRYDNEINEEGYHYAYETSDGTKAEQTGRVIPGAQPEEGSLSVSGSYSYIGDDGQEYTVTYIADENGYRAEGAHLPTPPPVPEAILKSLELNDGTRGQYDSNKSSYDADAGY